MTAPRVRPLVAPPYLNDGGMVTCAAGNHARVAYRDGEEVREVWRSIESLRVQQTDPLDVATVDSWDHPAPAFVGGAP